MTSADTNQSGTSYDESNDRWWVEQCKDYRSSILQVSHDNGMGTGWIAATTETEFVVVTANHVVSCGSCGKPEDNIVLSMDAPNPWRLPLNPTKNRIVRWRDMDVACIRITAPPPGPPLPLLLSCLSDDEPGAIDIAVPSLGLPVGWIGFSETADRIFQKPTVTFCQGRISAVGVEPRDANAETPPDGIEQLEKHVFLLDGNINCGMSGGPVWGADGHIMGIVTAFIQTSGTLHGVIVPLGYVLATLRAANVILAVPTGSKPSTPTPLTLGEAQGDDSAPDSQFGVHKT